MGSGLGAGLTAGSVLGRGWQVCDVIGTGGTATVYRVIQADGRSAAAKVMHAHLGATWSRRFEREARVLSGMRHRGLPLLYDLGRIGDVPFLILELFEGCSLNTVLHDSPGTLPLSAILDYADAALEVLSLVHARGIIHRDIKPSNLFVTRDGALKVLDFGIAGSIELEQTGPDSRTKGWLGTPAYMPPEQARGRWDLVDQRSDLWALGAVLWTLLTRRHVHPAETPNEQLALAMSRSAPSLRLFVPTLAGGLARVVDRALAYDREDRWQSASEFREAIRRERSVGAREELCFETTRDEAPPSQTLVRGFQRFFGYRGMRSAATAALLTSGAIATVAATRGDLSLPGHSVAAAAFSGRRGSVATAAFRGSTSATPAISPTDSPLLSVSVAAPSPSSSRNRSHASSMRSRPLVRTATSIGVPATMSLAPSPADVSATNPRANPFDSRTQLSESSAAPDTTKTGPPVRRPDPLDRRL